MCAMWTRPEMSVVTNVCNMDETGSISGHQYVQYGRDRKYQWSPRCAIWTRPEVSVVTNVCNMDQTGTISCRQCVQYGRGRKYHWSPMCAIWARPEVSVVTNVCNMDETGSIIGHRRAKVLLLGCSTKYRRSRVKAIKN